MIVKLKEKEKALRLRREGKTYSEILSVVPVAKSTLSLWLKEVSLSKRQVQRITRKREISQKKGADARRNNKISQTISIHKSAMEEIGDITEKELFLIGVVLYWAEGTKEKNGKAVMVDFANSDPEIIKIFLRWLTLFGGVKNEEIMVRLHIHDSHILREKEIRDFWIKKCNLKNSQFLKTNIKKHNIKTKRKNTGTNYKGLLSVRVKKSTNLNRRIQGLIYGIIAGNKYWDIV